MKTYQITLLLFCSLLTGCGEPGPEVKPESGLRISMGDGEHMRLKVVVLDGVEYYASNNRSGWILGPKKETRAEK